MSEEPAMREECLHRFRTLEEKCLLGNGQPSHAERISRLERSDETKTWLLRAVLGAVIANILLTILK